MEMKEYYIDVKYLNQRPKKKICTQNNKLCCERKRREYVMQTGFSRFFSVAHFIS